MRFCVINGYPDYTIYEDGTILNHKTFYIMGQTITREKVVVSLRKKPNEADVLSYSRLVAEHFVPNPENKKIVRPIDGNFKNFNASNLEWGSYSEWFIKYDNEEDRKKARLGQYKKCRDKRNDAGLVKPEQRKWRQSDMGHFIRNRNHWKASGMVEPLEGWEDFYFNTFKDSTNCELCNVEFNPEEIYMTQRCLDHDHLSGHKRFICCRSCNNGCLRDYDKLRLLLMLELHRYFNLN
jgi:hypothetical protein